MNPFGEETELITIPSTLNLLFTDEKRGLQMWDL